MRLCVRYIITLVLERDLEKIQQFVRNYSETYFRELIETIQKEAWQLAMDPDVLAKLTKVSGNLR